MRHIEVVEDTTQYENWLNSDKKKIPKLHKEMGKWERKRMALGLIKELIIRRKIRTVMKLGIHW